MTPRPPAGVIVDLDGRTIDSSDAVVYADDPTVLRGDGVFETILVRHGRPCLLAAHLDRLSSSAATTGLPAPDDQRWRGAVAAAVSRWTGGDAVLRLIYGSGRGGVPTAFVTVSAVPDRVATARRDGVSAVTLDRGFAAYDAGAAPWSLARVKSLSYAPFAAAQRQAERQGATDVVMVSSDGFVLEGSRSAVVVAPSPGVLQTPPPTAPILPGTTARALLDTAGERGWRCEHRWLRVSDLAAAQGIWLVSSVTLAARVHTLDGERLPPSPMSAEVAALVDAAILTDQ